MRNVPLCFFFLLVSLFSKKFLHFSLNFFSKQKLCQKNFMFFCLSVPFSFRVFLSSVFHVVRFLFDFSRSPSQHASISKCLLFLFISSFCSSSFHLFSLFCLLLFSRFFHLLSSSLNFLFWVFWLSPCFLKSNSLCNKSIFLGFCPDLLFLSSCEENMTRRALL